MLTRTVSQIILFITFAVWAAAQSVPTGVTFQANTIWRSDGHGDNWGITWGAKDQITSMDDGDWLDNGTAFHNHLHRLEGGVDDFVRKDVPGYPAFTMDYSWFGME